MIFIPLIHGIYPIQHHGIPLRPIARHDGLHRQDSSRSGIPGAVRFQIALVDHVQTQSVAQVINPGIVRIVAGADRVDVVLFHGHQILPKLRLVWHTARARAEFMTVYALEHNALPVQLHQAVRNLKAAEAHLYGNHLLEPSLPVAHLQHQLVQIRLLRTPQQRLFHRQHQPGLFLQGSAQLCRRPGVRYLSLISPKSLVKPVNSAFLKQFHLYLSLCRGRQLQHQRRLIQRIVQQRLHLHISDMYNGYGIEIHIPENTGKTEEILILAPAAGAPFEHLCCQLVFPLLQIGSQIELRGGKAVLTVPHIAAVTPQSKSAFHPLERDIHRLPLPFFGHLKIFHIACHRIKALGNLSRKRLFSSVPGILYIGILGRVVSLHLNMCRNADIRPAPAVAFRFLEVLYHGLIIRGIGKLPQPV